MKQYIDKVNELHTALNDERIAIIQNEGGKAVLCITQDKGQGEGLTIKPIAIFIDDSELIGAENTVLKRP